MAWWWLAGVAFPLAYVLTMVWLWRGWRRLPAVRIDGAPRTDFTVVVPARNESAHLARCLDALLAQDYPADRFRIVVVDDHSEDETAALARRYADRGVVLLRLADLPAAPSGKKAALAAAIQRADTAWIATTDADTQVPSAWLRHLDAAIRQTDCLMVGSAVRFEPRRGLWACFQQLDCLGTMGLTGAGMALGGPYLSNGASLAFAKKAWQTVGGYAGTTHRASGDDMLLQQKFARRWPDRLFWVKNPAAAVLTPPQPDGRSLWRQRRRWASKAHDYHDPRMAWVQAVAFGVSLQALAGLLLAPFWTPAFVSSLLAWWVRGLTDGLWLRMLARHFGESRSLRCFLPALVLHVSYVVALGLSSFRARPYEWKGRRVR